MIEKDTFLFHFIKETGGLHDPNLIKKILTSLEEWIPEEKSIDDLNVYDDLDLIQMHEGWNAYRKCLLEKLK